MEMMIFRELYMLKLPGEGHYSYGQIKKGWPIKGAQWRVLLSRELLAPACWMPPDCVLSSSWAALPILSFLLKVAFELSNQEF